MKNIQNKYLSWGLTALGVIAAAIVFYFIVLRLDKILWVIGQIFVILKPLIYGLVIAFLLTQSYNFLDRRLIKLLSKKIDDKDKVKKISKIVSIVVSILVMLLFLFLILYILIPKLIINILAIIEALPDSMDNIELWLRNILKTNSTLENIVLGAVNNSSNSILTWISTGVLPTFENIFSSFTTGLNDMYIFLRDFLIGIIFSVYIVINKKSFLAHTKKVTYALLGVKNGNALLEGARYSYRIFNGFIKGKLLTSIGLAIVCYLLMIMFGMPYALLISIIVGITNIIPFFGPFIGWIPGVIILLLNSPIQALYFSIIILVLQQIEGNIIAPKVVSNKTGLSSFGVLFSIVVFGNLFGFVGMIIGVPIFAIIYHFLSYYLKKYLEKKNLPSDTKDYDNIKYIDETTRKPIK